MHAPAATTGGPARGRTRESAVGARRTRRTRRLGTARGLSLFELLIALALVIAAAAIALPALDRVAADRGFDAALDDLDARLRQARAHALRTGRAVEVAFERSEDDPDRVWMRARYADGGAEGDTDGVAASGRGRADDDPALVVAAWARRPLPRGLAWREPDPLEDAFAADPADLRSDEDLDAFERDLERSFADAAAAFEARGAAGGRGADEDRRVIAVFLPDGGALDAGAIEVEDGEGRRGRITVAPLSGMARCVRVESGDEVGGEPPDDADDADEAGASDDADFRADEPAGDRGRGGAGAGAVDVRAPRPGTAGSDDPAGDGGDAGDDERDGRTRP